MKHMMTVCIVTVSLIVPARLRAQEKGVDIYVAGSYYSSDLKGSIACYWKNGKVVYLNDKKPDFSVTGIAVAGRDVYVAGNRAAFPGGNVILAPCIWKNGVLQAVEYELKSANVQSLYIHDGDVYAGGSDYYTGCYWKNGKKAKGVESGPHVFAADGAVYSAGMFYRGGDFWVPAYWKNGVRTELPSEGRKGYAWSIWVDGADVLAGGYIMLDNNRKTACWWKNGTLEKLGGGEVVRVIAEKGKVYLAYNYNESTDRERKEGACYLVNGRKFDLADSVDALAVNESGKKMKYRAEIVSSVKDMAVMNGVVYCAGNFTNTSQNNHHTGPCYWVNRKRHEMGPKNISTLEVHGIAVTVK